jgi:NDMA-dependent alcohol dehydrogenase
MMKSRAAILRGVGLPWEVREIDIDAPRRGEVLVRMVSAGICHTDDHFATGDAIPTPELAAMMVAAGMEPPDVFPLIGGHEGAGTIEAVGPEVHDLEPGDHVATSWIPTCGRCRWCAVGQGYLCDRGANIFSKNMVTDGTPRRHMDGVPLTATTQLGSFSEYMVAAADSVVKIDATIPLDVAALVSCGVTTGWGSATNAADTQPGDTAVVIGTGGVGMSAVQGARAAGAQHVVAIDPVEFKREQALNFGATHSSPSAIEAFELIRDLTHGVMADRVIVTVGVLEPDLIPIAMALTRKGGTCVLTAMAPLRDTMVPLMLVDIVSSNKQLKGTLYGGMNVRSSMPKLLSMYQSGDLKISELITRRYQLDDINTAIEDLREGRNIRGVIDFDVRDSR